MQEEEEDEDGEEIEKERSGTIIQATPGVVEQRRR